MARPRIGIAIELEWPGRRHLDVLAGIHRWVGDHGDWDISLDESITSGGSSRLDRYDGVIARVTPSLAAAARKKGVPLVNVWRGSPVVDAVAGVFPCGASVGRMAAEFILGRGFSSFACLSSIDTALEKEVTDSFCETIETARPGLTVEQLSVRFEDVTNGPTEAFLAALDAWVTSLPKPVALFCPFMGATTRYVCEELKHMNVRVPEDVALIGVCDETLICELVKPTLTVVDIPFVQVGYAAAAMLDGLMQRPATAAKPRIVTVPAAGVVARESTDLFATDDALVRRIMRHIETNLGKPLDPGTLAKRFSVSRRTLDRRFHASCGRPVSDVIRHTRFEKARHLLMTTDLLVKEIARRVGLTKPIQLHHLFHQKAGINPTEYRHAMRPSRPS